MPANSPSLLFPLLLISAAPIMAQPAPLPEVRQNQAARQLFVDGKPFVMLAGELHNSSASSVEYMRPIWDKLAAMHLNTVIGTASWELVEPEEGRFDFSLVDAQIRSARERGMRLALIWFATWKNAGSSYVPHWVKADRKRFPPMVLKVQPGKGMSAYLAAYMESQGSGPLSPFGSETLKADARAFAALMRHIRTVDPQHTVILMQVENEAGSLGDSRDRSPAAEAAWTAPVPAALMGYLAKHRAALLPELAEVWGRNGHKPAGTWAEVFGTDAWADEVFMAYHVGRYIGEVARAGKAELNLPMYANAWLGPQPGQDLPGQYPSGGPVARVLDVYRAAAPALDLLAPDIYVKDFEGTCALYARSGNPLFIPEARDQVGNLFWALGRHAALGWAPFGIEDLKADGQVAQAYGLLAQVLPQLAAWQAGGQVTALLAAEDGKVAPASLGGYRITLKKSMLPGAAAQPTGPELPGNVAASSRSMPDDTRPFALVARIAPDEFLFVGANGDPGFVVDSPGLPRVMIAERDEGRLEHGRFVPGRRLNGDEVFQPGLPTGRIGVLRVRVLRYE